MLSEQPPHVSDHVQVPETSYEEDLSNEAEVVNPSDNEDRSITEEEIVEPPTQLNQSEVLTVTSELSASQDDAPKKSYASIVSLMAVFMIWCWILCNNLCKVNYNCCEFQLKTKNSISSPTPVKAPNNYTKVKPLSSNQEATVKPAPVTEPSVSTSETGPEKSDVLEEGSWSLIFSLILYYIGYSSKVCDIEERMHIIK